MGGPAVWQHVHLLLRSSVFPIAGIELHRPCDLACSTFPIDLLQSEAASRP